MSLSGKQTQSQSEKNPEVRDGEWFFYGGSPVLSNTGVLNSQREEGGKLTEWSGGEDTVEVGLGVLWPEEKWAYLAATLEECKREAREEGADKLIKWSGYEVAVNRKAGEHYSWSIEVAGFQIRFQNKTQPYGEVGAETPNVNVRMGAIPLTVKGLRACWFELQSIVEKLGGILLWDKLSRVDMCADTTIFGMQDFSEPIQARFMVMRAKLASEFVTHGKYYKVSGYSFGRGDVMLRIYDKLLEVKKNPVKLAMMEQFRWGGKPEKATRIEFQMRREMLREFGVGTMGAYLEKRGEVARYLTEKWFRLTAGYAGNGNTRRLRSHSMWEGVQRAFAAWAGAAPGVAVRAVRAVRVSVAPLMRMVEGCVASAVAYLSEGEIYDFEEIRKRAVELVWNSLTERVVDKFEERHTRMITRGILSMEPAF